MSFLELFAPHLPYLRRYARALTGSQRAGDSYIEAALKALAADPEFAGADVDIDPRMSLYRFVHAIWDSSGAQLEDAPGGADGGMEPLSKLAPRQRQAFLLTSLESFSYSQAAQILRVSAAEIDHLVIDAQREIEAELRTKILIVEDEPVIAADLEALVTELGHEVTGHATTYDEALELAARNPPGIVLCDIQLADDSSGIDVAKDVVEQFDVPVVFITAFPERLLTGRRPEPTYLVSKPFQDNSVKAAIGQALFFHPRRAS